MTAVESKVIQTVFSVNKFGVRRDKLREKVGILKTTRNVMLVNVIN